MTAKHLLSEIVAGLDGVSIPDDIRLVATNIVTDICVKRGQMIGFRNLENEYLERAIAEAVLAERDRIRAIAAYVEQLEKALESIAKNTCCDSCREAALVARAALGGSNE